MSKLTPKKALEILNASNFEIAPELEFLVFRHDYLRRGVVQAWECPKCGYKMECPIPASSVGCKCGKVMKKIWG